MTDKEQKILSEITTRKLCTMDEHMAFYNDTAKEDYRFLSEIEELIKALQEEPVSEDLEEAVNAYIGYAPEIDESSSTYGKRQAFKAGANWQKEQMIAKAVSGHVGQTINGMLRALSDETFGDMGFTAGDKVKLIIIKED